MTHKSKWLLFSPLGLLAVGAGACLVDWAGQLKASGAPARRWVAAGTGALVVLNAGLSLFGRGVAEDVLHQLESKKTGQEPKTASEDSGVTF
ncbi:MAG: hypothetical protein ACRYFX_28380 [Janthinobacterium lividum]